MTTASATPDVPPSGLVLRSIRRGLVSGIGVGAALAVTLVLSRELLGGRAVPFWLENTAGLWFVAAFVAGAIVRRPVAGGLAGLLALVLALAANDSVSFVTGDGFSVQLLFHVRPQWALVSAAVGVAFGVLGGWTAATPERWWLGVALVGGLVVGEVAALFTGGPPHPAFDGRVGAVQVLVAIAAVLVAVGRGARSRAIIAASGVALAVVAVESTTGLVTRLIWG